MVNVSKLSINEQKEYLNSLKDKVITYKNKLNFDSNITFGVEIEYENILKSTVDYNFIKKKHSYNGLRGWINKSEIDISTYDIYGNELNGEINSPILKNNIKDWKSLKSVLKLLKNNGGYVSDLSGGHIHIGSQILGNNINYWENFLTLWMIYEEDIIKFCSGEFNTIRPKQAILAKRLNNLNASLLEDLKKYNLKLPELYLEKIRNSIYVVQNVDIFDKNFAVHLLNIGNCKFRKNNTIEFRCPNASLDEAIWQNNINFFINFLLTCKKDLDFDSIINNKYGMLELADLVFNDQNDKDNFLIQALKLNNRYNKELRYYIKR